MYIHSSYETLQKQQQKIQSDHESIENIDLETAYEQPIQSLPTIFSIASQTVTSTAETKAPDFYEAVELCRQNTDGYPPVVYAVKIGRHDLVKFFIDHGESVNAKSRDIPVWWDVSHNDRARMEQAGFEPGYTPLELAINQQDVEMVKILTTHNSENRANPEFNYQRFNYLFPYSAGSYRTHDRNANYRHFQPISSPLLDATHLGNQEIIDLVVKAYTNPEKLYAEYSTILALQQPESMRSWIEQNYFLWKGVHNEVPDSIVNLFLESQLQDAILGSNPLHTEQFLDYGWTVTKQEFEQAFVENNSQIIDLLIHHDRVEESPFFYIAKQNRADLVTRLLESGKAATQEHLITAINAGSVDVVKAFIQPGMPFDGRLTHAVQQKQKSVVEYMLTLPVYKKEIENAYTMAYQVHAYDIMDIVESKLSLL